MNKIGPESSREATEKMVQTQQALQDIQTAMKVAKDTFEKQENSVQSSSATSPKTAKPKNPYSTFEKIM